MEWVFRKSKRLAAFLDTSGKHLRQIGGLAELSKTAHENAAAYLKDNAPAQPLASHHLGKMRVAIKKHLAHEMAEIDKLVEKIIN